MTGLVYVIIYTGVVVFLVATIVRAISYARMPSHLRWELYPVPHEEPERFEHGGSYFESVDWWTQPRRFNLAGELKVMVPEMLLLKALREFNRKLWRRSFPFHFGLYLLIGTVALLIISALMTIFAPSAVAGSMGDALRILYTVTGSIGAAMATLGAMGLLHRRISDPDLRNYTVPGDIFNLLFFIVAFGFLGAGYLLQPAGASGTLAFTRGLLTFDTGVEVSGLLATGLILGALLVAYIPLTHMSHFVAKYFTYHSIRWDDLPSSKSIELRRRISEYLTYKPTWAAPHIGADGKKTWADIATTNPTVGARK